MPPDELSEDCKQRLRDLDRGLSQVMVYLVAFDFETSARLSGELVPLLDRATAPDEPCKKALRGLDPASTMLQQITRLDQSPKSRESVPRLLEALGQARNRIEGILGMEVAI